MNNLSACDHSETLDRDTVERRPITIVDGNSGGAIIDAMGPEDIPTSLQLKDGVAVIEVPL